MSVSLVSGWFPVVVPVVTVLAVVAGVDWRSRTGRRAFGGALVTAAVGAVAAWWAQARWAVVPYDVAVDTYLWIGLLVLAVGAPVAALLARHRDPGSGPTGRHRRRRVVWTRVAVAVVAVPLALASTAVAVNAQYAYYPTLGSLQGDDQLAAQTLSAFDHARRQWHHDPATASPTTGRGNWSVDGVGTAVTPVGDDATSATSRTTTPDRDPTRTRGVGRPPTSRSSSTPTAPTRPLPPGTLVEVDIPGHASGFAARTAWVWAPPLVVTGAVTHPPVVMLLSGSPGQTSDWIRGGNAVTTAQRWADEHHGVAPMLVFPDANGSATADTECVDSHRGHAETYLTQDVPAFLASTFGAVPHRWSVAGLSEGGECAAMLGLRHPDLFAAFADFSGLTSPSLTERIDRTGTARELFDGNVQAYDEHDPLWLLAHAAPRTVTAYWQTGADDARGRTAQRTLSALATSAGLTVHALETPGQGHDFTFWSEAFAASLPTLAAAMTDPDPATTTGR